MVEISIPLKWAGLALVLISLSGLSLGALSAFSPERSIALYQWIMRKLNWLVEPLDVARERRTTRIFGILTIALAGAIVWLVFNSGTLSLPG